MMQHRVRTPADALVYLTDCTLATVATMRMKKSSSKHELRRQINMAQKAMDWIESMGVDCRGTRMEEVFENFGGKVEAWAETYHP